MTRAAELVGVGRRQGSAGVWYFLTGIVFSWSGMVIVSHSDSTQSLFLTY